MTRGARTPERVYDKLKECNFFLVQMAQYELTNESENFLHCISAFLSAFRTVAYRLYGVTETQRGKAAKVSLMKQLHAYPQIGFLISKSNVELHEDGVKVWQRYNLHVGDSMPSRWSRGGHERSRWSSRFEPRYPVQTSVTVVDWQFEESSSNLVALCHDALNEMENVVRQNITIGQTP